MRVGIVVRDGVLDQIEIDRRGLTARDREMCDARRDRLAPPGQRAVAAERRQRAEDLEERVLDQIFDLAVRTEDAIQRVMHRLLLRLEQLALRDAVAFGGAARELEVWSPGG